MNYRRKLFKYIDAEGAMRMLSNATLQFTNPCDFNDPFDCHPSLIDFSLGTSQRMCGRWTSPAIMNSSKNVGCLWQRR